MENKSNDVVDIEKCPVLCDELKSMLSSLRENLPKNIDEIQFLLSNNGKIHIGDIEYNVDNNVFFQSNIDIATMLLKYVNDNCVNGNVMYIYAGVGFFSVKFEKNLKIENIIAIEENKKCLNLAKKNLKCTEY